MAKKTPPKKPRDYVVGFGKPPASGQIKPGEVRNPFGSRGKPKPPIVDTYNKIMTNETDVMIGSVRQKATLEEAVLLQLVALGLKGSVPALRALRREGNDRSGKGPPPPTAEELAEAAAEDAEREKLSASLMALLQRVAALKKLGLTEPGDPLNIAPWVFDALRAYRVSLGDTADPVAGKSWMPMALRPGPPVRGS
jgi:hypothetical protein